MFAGTQSNGLWYNTNYGAGIWTQITVSIISTYAITAVSCNSSGSYVVAGGSLYVPPNYIGKGLFGNQTFTTLADNFTPLVTGINSTTNVAGLIFSSTGAYQILSCVQLTNIFLNTAGLPGAFELNSVAIGSYSGQVNQGLYNVAIGYSSALSNQSPYSIAIGSYSGKTYQGSNTVAIGYYSGSNYQANLAVAIGYLSAFTTQGEGCIAIGPNSGQYTQGQNSIAIGYRAGQYGQWGGDENQSNGCIAIGNNAGRTFQGTAGSFAGWAIAIGDNAGSYYQAKFALAIGTNAGANTQGENAIAIGNNAGKDNQVANAVAIGSGAGQINQGVRSVAIGLNSGNNYHGEGAIGIGENAGYTGQGAFGIGIGVACGQDKQGVYSVAIGNAAGQNIQDYNSISIGYLAGQNYQSTECIAIGDSAGNNFQGSYAIAIGYYAGNYFQPNNSIVINATTSQSVNATVENSCIIAPIRNDYNQLYSLNYNITSSEVTYAATPVNWVGITTVAGTQYVAVAFLYGTTDTGNGATIRVSGTFGGYGSTDHNKVDFIWGTRGSVVVYGQMYGFISATTLSSTYCDFLVYSTGGGSVYTLYFKKTAQYIWYDFTVSALSPNTNGGIYAASALTSTAPSGGSTTIASVFTNTNINLLDINGVLSYNGTTIVNAAGTKTFVIDHPTKPDNYLVHSCLEGPESGVYYRGKAKIVNGQFVKINLPDYTSAWYDFTISVTAIGKPRICGADEVFNGSFLIYGDSGVYHWTVYAKRGDIDVEPLKSETSVHGSGPYRWIN
jgi:hypothetical protein